MPGKIEFVRELKWDCDGILESGSILLFGRGFYVNLGRAVGVGQHSPSGYTLHTRTIPLFLDSHGASQCHWQCARRALFGRLIAAKSQARSRAAGLNSVAEARTDAHFRLVPEASDSQLD